MNGCIFSGDIYAGESNFICPVCEYDYTHIGKIYTLLGSDENEAGVYPGTEIGGATKSRRSALAIEFWCEQGHAFKLIIQQHKGINLVDVKPIAARVNRSRPRLIRSNGNTAGREMP